MPADLQRSLITPDPGACPLGFGGSNSATLVIDTAKSQIVSASASGLERLGLPPTAELPLPLDDAMPAVQRLRQLAASNGNGHAHSGTFEGELIFWIDDRVARLDCSAQAAVGKSDERLVVVTAAAPKPVSAIACEQREATVAETIPAGLKIPDPESAPLQVAPLETLPPLRVRDDAQTLKDIARAIREGQAAHRIVHEPAPTALIPATPMTDTVATKSELRPVAAEARQTFETVSAVDQAKLAHELTTPLSAILAAAEIMRDERLGPMGNARYLGYASDVHDSASHALDVIKKMLNGEGSGSSQPDFEATDLNALCRRVVSSMLPLAKGRSLTLELDLTNHLPRVIAGQVELRQILINLLNNALKFTPPGGQVHVVTGYLEDGSVFMVVRDTGDGMTAEDLERAFNNDKSPEALDLAAQRPGGGHGIGLPLVRRLAEANFADLEIDSAPGKGTVVLLAFPPNRLW